jgi:hypothetical protein
MAKPRCGFCDQAMLPETKAGSVVAGDRVREGYYVFCSNCEAVVTWVPTDSIEVFASLVPEALRLPTMRRPAKAPSRKRRGRD